MTQQADWHAVWRVIRATLEALYFLSGVGILIAALYGLKQLKLTKELAENGLRQLELTQRLADSDSKRESVKLAATQCRYFAEIVVPALDAVLRDYLHQKLTFLNVPPGQPPAFVLHEGKFVQAKYDAQLIEAQWLNIAPKMVTYLNAVESFAIPFAAKVASDEIGFQETSANFCTGVSTLMPVIYHLMQTQKVGYPSLLMLYCIWNNRIAANVAAPLLAQMQALITTAENEKKKLI
ncbi:MAG TPA: hypothetical protein VN881_09430 [Candidatus Acidoferrales bacterium]|nr:hypothetical protein [Candidatus Acidoferrales bacterium]